MCLKWTINWLFPYLFERGMNVLLSVVSLDGVKPCKTIKRELLSSFEPFNDKVIKDFKTVQEEKILILIIRLFAQKS